MIKPDLLDGGYAPTLHWACSARGFDSILTVFNYYGLLYPDASPSDTDCVLHVRFFDTDGTAVREQKLLVATGETMRLRISQVLSDFSGLTMASLVPNGRMARRSARGDKPSRPIATSFFMLYERGAGFVDYSHELFVPHSEPALGSEEWASMLYLRPEIEDSGFIVMNNRPTMEGAEYHSRVEAGLLDLTGRPMTDRQAFDLRPGGSRWLQLSEMFPQLETKHGNGVLIVVKGTNIEQPMTVHLHRSGDFNIHHF